MAVRRLIPIVPILVSLSNPSLAGMFGNTSREIDGGASGGTRGSIVIPSMSRPASTEEEPYRNADRGPLGVVLSNGEFQITVTDLEIPGRGFPFRLTRTYRSKKDLACSFLGYNWHLNYDEYLQTGIYVDAYGVAHPSIQWTMANGWRELWIQWDETEPYKPFSGFFGKIRSLGTGQGYQIRYPDGTVKTFGASIPRTNGSLVWALSRMEDRNGNAITIRFKTGAGTTKVFDTITDTLGRKVGFNYDLRNRLTSVVDFAGRRIDYGYDSDDNLIWVKSPEVRSTPNGNNFCEPSPSVECAHPRKKTTYTYNRAAECSEGSLAHNLVAIADGKGETFLTNRYFSSQDSLCGTPGPFPDYVASQVYGTGTVTYAYQSFWIPPDPSAGEKAFSTTVTDRMGNVQVHDFNSQGNPLRIEYRTNRGIRNLAGLDEPDYVETYTYVDHGGGDKPMLVSSRTEAGGYNVDPAGNLVTYGGGATVVYNYDQANPDIFQRGNLLSAVQTPGPRGGAQPEIQITYTYEPLFNQRSSITDPRSHDTLLTYDFQEGSYSDLIAGSPPPVSVAPVWWPQSEVESFMSGPANANKGDLNGDGYHRGGNLVRAFDGTARGADGTSDGIIPTHIAYNSFGLPTTRRDAELNETHFVYFPENDPDGDGSATPAPPDGRVLSSASGPGGGGYVQRKVLDATPTMPLPVPPLSPGRETGQDPPPQNVNLSFTYDPVGNIKTSVDGRGIRADYGINALNQLVQKTRAAASADPNAPAFGYREQFEYDANNSVVRHRTERRDDGSTAASSPIRWITMDTTYDVLGHKLTETVATDDSPAISLTTTYAYDANGNLRKTVFPAGNAVLRLYDERDLPYREVVLKNVSRDPDDMSYNSAVDSVSQYDYDGSGNVIQLRDPEGHVARTGYDGYNRKLVGFDPAYQKAAFTYDAGGNILTQASFGSLGGPTPAPSQPPVTPYPELSRQTFYYDELGRLRRTDTRFFTYEGATQVAMTTDSNAGLAAVAPGDPIPAVGDGTTTSLVYYDRLGRVVRRVDDNGHASEIRYDGLGRKLKVLLNAVAPFVYSQDSPDERNLVDYTYDADDNLVRTVETEWGADRSDPGNPDRKLPSQRFQTDFRYDSMNRLVETRRVGRLGSPALNHTTSVAYDSRGNKIQITDAAGGRTRWFYDGLNRLIRTESGYFWNGSVETIPSSMVNTANPDGKITTRYDYNANSRLTSIVDDNNRTTSFQYDHLNRQTRITYPDSVYKQLTYDKDSLATTWEQVSFSGVRLAVTTRYDALHRAVQKDVDTAAAPAFTGAKRQLFEYDGQGRMTVAKEDVDPTDGVVDSEVALAYNSLGRVVSEGQTFRDLSSGQLVQGTNAVVSVYNGVGFRTKVTYPGGRTVALTSDEVNRLDVLTDSYTGTTRYDYLGPSRLLNRIYPNNTKLTMLGGSGDTAVSGYDGARRVVDFAHRTTVGMQASVAEFTYGYDAVDNRLFERRLHEPSGAHWKGERYGYDAAYRLISRQEGSLNDAGALQGTATSTQGYALDGLGNWSSHTSGSMIHTNTINLLNQYEVFNQCSGIACSPLQRTLSYDLAGNLTDETMDEGSRQYAYDFSNRLVTYLDTGFNLTTYKYDALGRRISKNLNGGTHTRFVYDGSRLIEERDEANAVVASYVYGAGDEVVTRRRRTGGVSSDLFYHTNSLGSVVAVTASDGSVVERYRYDAYGQVTFLSPALTPLTSSSLFNNVLFTGQYYDTESKLYYYRARTYHPVLGRFLQRDPLGESASLNLYAYVFNNPVNATDPTGLITFSGSVLGQKARESFFAGRGNAGQGWSLQQRMQFRGGHYVNYRNAEFSGFEDAQAAEDHYAELEREQAEWDAKEERQKAAAKDRLDKLKDQLDKALKDPLNQRNMSNPKGLVLNILGWRQDIQEEWAGSQDDSELDLYGGDKREEGYVVLEVNGDDLASVMRFAETAQEAMGILQEAVTSVTDKLCGNMSVEINAFSRGSGGAITLTNMLTGGGFQGGDISLRLFDPYLSRNSNTVNDPNVHVTVFGGTMWDVGSLAANLGARMMGIGHRDVYQGNANRQVVPQFFYVPHTQMDTYVPGAMGSHSFLGY